MKALIVFLGASTIAGTSLACTTTFNVTLQTFGEGVSVELRSGAPGKSKVVAKRQTSGGTVAFDKLCAGDYFLAIGNGDSVNVTPVRTFKDKMAYTSKLTVVKGSGNVGRQQRGSL